MRTRTKPNTETRTRRVPITRNGKTVMGQETYTVDVPTRPADLDRYVRNGVLTAASLVLAACIVWSTASIGDLLSRVVTPAAAYAGAGVFDLVWISCTALEWLARHDPQRARLPRNAGYAALAVAMAAVTMHGKVAGYLAIGIVGAAVSALAKGLWTVYLTSTSMPLDPLTQQWVDAQRAEAGAQLAMIPVQRELARAEGLVQAERLAVGQREDSGQDSPGHDPGTVRAVRAVLDQVPGLAADEVIEHLNRLGVAHDEDTVRDIVDEVEDSQDNGGERQLRSVPTITGTIRAALKDNVQDRAAVIARVLSEHGPNVDTRSAVRILNRELAARKRGA